MSVKTWAIQLYGFLVKAALQRWRTPIGTVVELLLPCVFTLLLSLAYWTTESEDLPATMYDGPSAILFNFSSIVNSMKAFCTTPGSSLSTSWSTCSSDPSEYECISIVGNGNDLCLRNEKAATLGGLLFSQYYLSGPTALYPMDIYLTISAFVTDTSNKLNPTFFGRGGQASLSHYGKLLVASESTSLGEAFMDFCRKQSGMCGEVLYSSLFSKMGDAEDYALNHDNTVWAIVYLPEDILSATTQAEYTISMNYTATPWTFTNSRTSTFFRGDTGSSSSPGYQLYYNSGFMTLQTFVQEFFLQRNVENGVPVTGGAVYKSIKPFVGVNNYLGTWGSAVIPMPSPPQYSNAFMDTWAYYVPLVAMFAALFPIARVTGLIVDEKPEGIREAMLIMGLHPTCLFAGWYASSLVVDLVASLLAAMVLKIGFLHYVSYGVLLALYFSFMQQNTALTLLISSLFTNPRVASWCAAFVIFLCAIPFYSFPEGMSDGSKIGVALVPCVGYTEAFSILTEYATFGQDFRWEDAHSGKFCVAVAIGMMWASFVVMMVLAYYLDRVGPGRVGCRPSYYFFLEPLLALCRTKAEPPMLRMGVNTSPDMDGDGVCEAAKLLEHNGEVVDPCDSSVAAVAYQLRKTHNCGGFFGFWYTFFTGVFRDGDRVESLRGVSFAMKTGEVSVLLGPNGAGKSTLMGVVTGMVRATDGDVYVRGRNLTSELDECRQNIGYCPQSDTVWSWMTVEEHLTFYARLKGADSVVVQPHVDEAIELVGLTEKRDCRAGCLSGGQRRRLCVAIALVGGSSVLLLDEPTAGMDMKGRRTVYDALNRARAERSVLISTHLLDEADRIGDRILLMNEGQLCGEGSAMFLKSRMSVGYIVTCVLDNDMDAGEEDRAVSSLIDFVREKGYEGHRCPHSGEIQAIPPTCKLLGVERRGREVRFRFPMSLLSTSGRQLMTSIEEQRKKLSVRSVGLSLTTLEDVFMTATQGSPLMSEEAVAEHAGDDSLKVTVVRGASDTNAMYTTDSSFAVFSRHFRALFLKRVHFAKRDMRLLFFQVLIPVVFLLLSLMINLVRAPNQPSLLLDMSMYGESATSEVLYSCGNTPGFTPNAFVLSADIPASAFGTNYNPLFVTPVMGTTNGTLTLSKQLMSEVWTHTESRYVALSPSNFLVQSGPPTYGSGVLHNASAAHSAPQAIDSLYALANHQLFGSNVPQIITRNKPMHLGAFEDELVSANKQVLVGIFILLPFIFIPANTISYIVREKVCGARHLQWLSGANAAAYWISSFVFDALCFIGTTVLAFCILAIFRRTEYVGKDQLGPSVVLFLFFGLSSIPFSYVLSFFFKSPFAAQNTVLIINFVFGFLWVLVESMVYNGAPNFVRVVTYIVRTFPSVAFSEGMFVLSGQELALLMMPQLTRPNMFALLHFDGAGHSVFKGGIGTGLIYMSCTFVVSIVLLVVLEYVRVQRLSGSVAPCGSKDVDEEAAVAAQMDESVMAEEFRVCADAAGPSTDCIAMQHLRKRYSGASRAAVSNLSLGVHQGEILGLLGLNGAGKTTAVGMLAGEVVPSGGDAFVNHVSINKPESRSFVGYCPQFDALLDNLSVTEHLWLYARLRGMREEVICDEVEMLTEELGLYPHRLQTAAALSGGNRRRLSLAIALVGRTTSVLLDEPTAGMDAIARAQTCAMVKRLTQDKSVVLTTHLLDEVDALADRVAVISRGDLRCVGTPQELKGRFTKDAEFTVRVLFPHTVSLVCEDQGVVERVRAYVLSTAGHTPNGEEPSCDVDELGVCSMSLKVRSSICDLCGAVSSLSEGGVEGIPRPTYVSLSQPTLEDILVQE